MILHPLDAPIAIALGAAIAVVYKYRLSHNPDLFVLAHLLVVILWANLLIGWILTGTPLVAAWTVQTESTLLAVMYPLSYPLWFHYSAKLCFMLIGRRPDQGGLVWLYTVRDRTQPFEPPWDDE